MYIKTTENVFFEVGPVMIYRDVTTVQVDDVTSVDPLKRTPSRYITVPDSIDNDEVDVHDWLISEEGPFPGATLIDEDDYVMTRARLAKAQRVKELRNIWEVTPVTTPFGTVDADMNSQQKITGAVVMALILGQQFAVKWRMSDNAIVDLTDQQMIQMGMIVGQTVAKYQMIKNYFDGLINEATTLEELNAINIEQNWLEIPLA